jgi:hypothetical protein
MPLGLGGQGTGLRLSRNQTDRTNKHKITEPYANYESDQSSDKMVHAFSLIQKNYANGITQVLKFVFRSGDTSNRFP